MDAGIVFAVFFFFRLGDEWQVTVRVSQNTASSELYAHLPNTLITTRPEMRPKPASATVNKFASASSAGWP